MPLSAVFRLLMIQSTLLNPALVSVFKSADYLRRSIIGDACFPRDTRRERTLQVADQLLTGEFPFLSRQSKSIVAKQLSLLRTAIVKRRDISARASTKALKRRYRSVAR